MYANTILAIQGKHVFFFCLTENLRAVLTIKEQTLQTVSGGLSLPMLAYM